MTPEQFLANLSEHPEAIQFTDTMAVVDANYNFTPCKFINGDLTNEANQNNGSCKLLAFAKLHMISKDETLHCFGDYYRQDVLAHPNNTDHQNIRNLMLYGLEGVLFESAPLTQKVPVF
tara:strand:- start:24826 stop:25182 length:357 start_codon:yes stop_codon:yes gene_type:complete